MMNLFFLVKTFVLTVAIVLMMQIKVGERSIESHAMGFVQSSTIAAPLNSVARGAAKLINDFTEKVKTQIYGSKAAPKKKERDSSLFSYDGQD